MKGNVFPIADVYAEALLAAAREAVQQEVIVAEFEDLIAFMQKDADFNAFLTAESVDDDPRRESLEKLFRGKMNDLFLNLLLVLNDRKRLILLPAIYRAVQLRLADEQKQQEIFVDTAVSLTDDLRSSIRREVQSRIGKEPILIERVKPELIGGLVILIGDVRIDGSVATRIRAMRRRLLERASEEIHKNGQYVEG